MLQTAETAAAAQPTILSAPKPDMTDDETGQQARAEARLTAFRLVVDVQQRDTGNEIADRLTAAEAQGWSEVVRALLYADVVRAWAADADDREATIERLHDVAERDGDPVWLASALASRAEYRYAKASADVRERANRDLARAVALLEVSEGGALECAVAYIDCGLAYGQRELWELEEPMYARSAAALAASGTDIFERALLLNRITCILDQACSLHELGHHEELRALWERLGPQQSGTGHLFDVEARVARHVLDRLVGEPPAEPSADIDRALTESQSLSAQSEHGLLRLADALAAADRDDWEEVRQLAATAIEQMGQAIGPTVVAAGLRLATRADLASGSAGAGSALAYCDWSARRRWDSRIQLLAAARATLEAEQLRVERDEHARDAQVDPLTGLANRRGYANRVEQLRTSGRTQRLAVLVVDIDAFKAVNDTYGHDVGDAVLVRVGQVLTSVTRQVDLVARLGGDEFVVLLGSIDETSVRRRADEVLDRCAGVDWYALAPGLRVRVSIGLATGSDDPERLSVRADQAMYAVKRRGGDGLTVAD